MEDSKYELLSRGSNSQIVLYDELVLKMVDVKYSKHTRHLINEYRVMKHLKHPNVLPCVGFKSAVKLSGQFELPDGLRDILLLEWAPLGSLLSYIKKHKLTIHQKMELIRQIGSALQYLHVIENVAHRDIKLDNIVLKQDHKGRLIAMISDFGFAVKGESPQSQINAHSCKGTKRGFMAPELHNLSGQTYSAKKLDVFSFAVVIFSLIFNKLPFEYSIPTDKYYGLIAQHKSQQFWALHKISSESHPSIPLLQDLKRLLQGMWEKQPSVRISIQEVMEHCWFSVPIEELVTQI